LLEFAESAEETRKDQLRDF